MKIYLILCKVKAVINIFTGEIWLQVSPSFSVFLVTKNDNLKDSDILQLWLSLRRRPKIKHMQGASKAKFQNF